MSYKSDGNFIPDNFILHNISTSLSSLRYSSFTSPVLAIILLYCCTEPHLGESDASDKNVDIHGKNNTKM